MCEARGGSVCAMDDRYCVDNGAMIAYAGVLQHKSSKAMNLMDCTFTQRFRTDEVLVTWRTD